MTARCALAAQSGNRLRGLFSTLVSVPVGEICRFATDRHGVKRSRQQERCVALSATNQDSCVSPQPKLSNTINVLGRESGLFHLCQSLPMHSQGKRCCSNGLSRFRRPFPNIAKISTAQKWHKMAQKFCCRSSDVLTFAGQPDWCFSF